MSKILTIETLQAKHGDCLLLYYGDLASPEIILIDGGPNKVYIESLKPRLLELKEKFSPNDSLNLSVVMVSHMDDDHINGILDLLEDLKQQIEDQEEPYLKINNIWYNTFDDIIGNDETHLLVAGQSILSSINGGFKDIEDEDNQKVLASTNQGRQLNSLNNFFRIPKNQNQDFLTGTTIFPQKDGLRLKVLWPKKDRLEALQTKWDKDLKKAKEKGDPDIIVAAAKKVDRSPFNLASIVCMVQYKKKKILLTGDARSDDILKGLRSGRFIRKGICKVDVLKLPHHGSDRNITTDFFRAVIAKHYIISADGKHHNPDMGTLDMLLVGTEGRNDFTVHLTNEDGKEDLGEVIIAFRQKIADSGRTFRVNVLPVAATHFHIDLLTSIDF